MPAPVIEVSNLSKRYVIGHETRPDTLRDRLSGGFRSLWKRRSRATATEEFWALRDVSFEVKRGEVVGIIGRNGAGKSTLLKILSRITEPTQGRVTLRGRVASLLEVGTGFHPELTGRENIFLNGAILGMSRVEIRKKFDEIVAFAEVEKFLDTPVKRYSSGMYVRLAFAVAAHLEPEILIVDEVLAVGDIAFQKKCLGKMQDVARGQGRTILFVSHNFDAVARLTRQAVFLEKGRIAFTGPTEQAVALYVATDENLTRTSYDVGSTPRSFPVNGPARFERLWFERETPLFSANETFRFHFSAVTEAREVTGMRVSFTVFASGGQPVGSGFGPLNLAIPAHSTRSFEVNAPSLRLAPGSYNLGIAIGEGLNTTGHVDYDILTEVLAFEVASAKGIDGTLAAWPSNWGPVVISPIHSRQTHIINAPH